MRDEKGALDFFIFTDKSFCWRNNRGRIYRGQYHMASSSPFLESVRNKIRLKHYSIRTEESYVQWVKRYILFHGKRHPNKSGA